ncbi:MAG: ribonuclease HII [Candidatus Omnitrophica bacterium]|nr:ribonuclease HII [Candidatus Omnitrophota bacterium]
MLFWERRAFLEGASIIIGVDEAGRGPLAGPVVAAACVLKTGPFKKRFILPEYKQRLDDSKKLSLSQREKSFHEISGKALFGIGLKYQDFIDSKNIRKATLAAMRQAVKKLIARYCSLHNIEEKDIRTRICVLVDGDMKPRLPYKIVPILKGDSKSISIAAASIIAKVTRDRIMDSYDKIYPLYGFSKHKGYGTRLHFETIRKYGPCPIHRKSFAPIRIHM